MDREEVKEKVYSILNSSGFGNIIDENYYFNNDLGLDSMDVVEFTIEIEKEFNIALSDENMEALYHLNVGKAIDMIHDQVK